MTSMPRTSAVDRQSCRSAHRPLSHYDLVGPASRQAVETGLAASGESAFDSCMIRRGRDDGVLAAYKTFCGPFARFASRQFGVSQ